MLIVTRSTITINTRRCYQALKQVKGWQLRTQEPRNRIEPALIQDKFQGIPRSYVVSTPSGRELLHNQSKIWGSPTSPGQKDRLVRFDLGRSSASGAAKSSNRVLKTNQSVSSDTDSPISQPVISGPGSGGQYRTCSKLIILSKCQTGWMSKVVPHFKCFPRVYRE